MKADERCFCGSRKAHNICHKDVAQDSKYANVTREYIVLDKFCKKKGVRNICIENCCQCCNDYFYISENEFLLILDYVMRNGLDLDSYISKAKDYREWFVKAHPEESSKIEGLMPTYEGIEAITASGNYFSDEAVDYARKCVFIENGKCSVYEVRPLLCRGYGSIFPCRIIDNADLRPEIALEKASSAIQMIESNNGDKISKRPYPLFYWLSEFLNDRYKETTMMKLKYFKTLSENEYYLLSLQMRR